MDPICVRADEAARLLGISKRKLRELTPELPFIRAGGCILFPVDALRRWAAERAAKGAR